MRKTFSIVLSLLISSVVIAQHQGRVFVDKNQNGKFDRGEQLLSGVMVTDGLNVVKTDSKGEFVLPGHAKERFITITTPSGYKTSSEHYIPINKDKELYEFALDSWKLGTANNGNHKFIQISDTEIFNTIDHERWVNNVRDYAANEDVAFIIHTGDICYENGMKKHIDLMNSKNMNRPMYYIIGNHDLVKGDYGEQLFESIYGPTWFSFDYGNVHYIVTPMPGGDYKPSYTEADVYAWLKNDLALVDKNTPIVCFNHDLKSYTDEFVFKNNDDEKLVLSDYNLKAWLYGHWHNHFVRQQGKVKTISTATLDKGGIDHSTSAFRLVSVSDKGNVSTQMRYTYINNHIAIASIGNESAALNDKQEVPLVVNAYNTTAPTQSVTYRLSDINGIIKDNQSLKQLSDWSWAGDISIPSRYANRQLFVEATATFGNGEIAKTRESFLYTPQAKQEIDLANNWTTLLGNSEHNAFNADSLKSPIQLAWINNIKANIFMSSPLIYNNMIYIASVDEDLRGEGGIYALDAKTGKQKWFYKTRNSIKNTIAIDNGNVFAQDGEGYLYAVNATSGKLVWEQKLGVNGLPVLDDGLTTRDGVVYAGSGKGFAAYDAKTGKQKWTNIGWGQGDGTTTTLAANDDVVIAGAQWRGLYANDAKTGKHLWTQSRDGISDRGASPALHNGLVYLISKQSLFVLEAISGNIIVSKKLNYNLDVTSTPLVTDNLIIFGTVDDGLVALDRNSFEEKWKVQTQIALVYTAPYTRHPVTTIETSPVRIGNHVVFGASDGYIYAANLKDGTIDWKHNVGVPIFSTIATSGNTFIVSDFGGNVYAFVSER